MTAVRAFALPVNYSVDVPVEAKHIRISMNDNHLEMTSNGTVRGTFREPSNQAVWHRIDRPEGEFLLRSSVYCKYLCINECGYVYSAILPNSECLWSEMKNDAISRFFVKNFGNDTAYLAIDIRGRPQRVIKGNNRRLVDEYRQARIYIENVDNDVDFANVCVSSNLRKLNYVPPKTCQDPPARRRHSHKKRNKNEKTTIVTAAARTPDDGVVDATIVNRMDGMPLDSEDVPLTVIPLGGHTDVPLTVIPLGNDTSEDVPLTVIPLGGGVKVKDGNVGGVKVKNGNIGGGNVVYVDTTTTNKTSEGAIPKNLYYHDEEFSIRTLDDERDVKKKTTTTMTTAAAFVDKNKSGGGVVVDEVKESVEKVISNLIAAGNSTSHNVVPFAFVHHTTSFKICFV